MNILEFSSEFKRKIRLQGGDVGTADAYNNCMRVFMKHYESKHSSPLNIPIRDIEDYIIHLLDQKYSTSYINQFIASAKRFYSIFGQPKKCAGLDYHSKQFKTPNVLTHSECLAMCNANVYIKHRVIINMLYWGALRRGELLRLKLTDFSDDRKVNILDSKYGKSRVITIPSHVLDLVNSYVLELAPKEYLLNGDGGRLMYSERSLENVVKNVGVLCGITKKLHPHILRSSRATHLLDNGASDMYVSRFLGHSKLQTTMDYYSALTIKGMQDNFDRADSRC